MFICAFALLSCDKVGIHERDSDKLNDLLPDESLAFAKSMSQGLVETTISMQRDGFDFFASIDGEGKDRLLRKYFSNSKICSEVLADKGPSQFFDESIASLITRERLEVITNTQWTYFSRILTATRVCETSSEYFSDLLSITRDIYSYVHPAEQKRLLNVIAIMGQLEETRSELIQSGVLVRMPNFLHLRSGIDESDSLGNERGGADSAVVDVIGEREDTTAVGDSNSFWEACRSVMAAMLIFAIDDPLLLSASEFTALGVFGPLVLMGMILCGDTRESDYAYENIRNRCIERFEMCSSPIPNGCSVCLQYCLNHNGEWPPYSSHQCT